MNNTSLYAPIYDGRVKMVKVSFHDKVSGKQHSSGYTYKCAFNVEVGDHVVCQSRGWVSVCTVTAVDVPIPVEDDDTEYRWVTHVLDKNTVDTISQWEEQLIELISRRRVESMRKTIIDHIGVQQHEITTRLNVPDAFEFSDDAAVIERSEQWTEHHPENNMFKSAFNLHRDHPKRE